MVNRKNCEEYMLLYADGELNATEEKQLLDYLNKHPELMEELALIQSLKLKPDTSMVYSDKEQLLKKETRIIKLGNWRMYSAAAGLALLILIAWQWMKQDVATHTVHQTTVVNKESREPVQPLQVVTDEPNNQPLSGQASVAGRSKGVHSNKIAPQLQNAPVLKEESVAIEQKQVKILPVVHEEQEMPVEQPLVLQEETVTLPHQGNEFMEWVPINNSSKEAIAVIKNEVDLKLKKVKNIPRELKNTDLIVKVGKKELFTINF